MEEGLAAAQYHAAYAQVAPFREPAFDVGGCELVACRGAPDVAHDTAAVAAAVGKEDEDRQARDRIHARHRWCKRLEKQVWQRPRV